MPGIRVVADSACDLPDDTVARHRLTIVPLTIRFGTEELADVGPKDFWVKCHQSSVLPATAAPAPGAFAAAFRQLAAEGADGIVCINLSGKLSATGQSAQAAARELDGEVQVEVVDSTSVSLGQGLLVLGAARTAEEGKGLAEVAAYVTGAAPRLKVYGVLDTLENLKKGGRIGGAQALLGSMLAIKPVIEIRDGVVHEESKQRTRGRSLHYLADKVNEAAKAGKVQELAIMHGDASDIDKFIDLVAVAVPREQMLVGLVGAVIGTHAGPGVVGVAWIEPQ
ncbi:MAG: fatty acid kinase fatty acid binding subunit [Acidimicrobiaceae bacterium]|jgi:DegV family protein with EDD domain|nr:fatty acid kinase fatty acid binding subunit [Acidimicrobiaceae bacterium]MDQ1364078.1 fatty acid kinase fatty acid binding subunit [Acidimicrobiaceae bacterium]MDQ1399447.1 fatty acid kinase fatty acid binding subunit [Acidimicrobiaceae bacterium]MDQ1420541.1 fatty acid kinase fatty acid binding subunit [Acidimicrobiaceae bacterium]